MGSADARVVAEPLKQGDLDGLCAVYAIGNALRRLYGEAAFDSAAFRNALLTIGAGVGTEGLAVAVAHGISNTWIAKLLAAVCRGDVGTLPEGARLQVRRPWQRGRLPTLATAAAEMRRVCAAGGTVLMTFDIADRRSIEAHLTVVDRVTRHRLYLRDSGYAAWLKIAEMRVFPADGLATLPRTPRCYLDLRSTWVLRDGNAATPGNGKTP